MFRTHFKILPEVPTSWSTWQILAGAKHTFTPSLFFIGGAEPLKPPGSAATVYHIIYPLKFSLEDRDASIF